MVLQDVDEMNLKQIYSKEWNLSTWLTREREDSSTSVTYEDLLSGVVRQTIKIICINELRGREAWGKENSRNRSWDSYKFTLSKRS